MPSSEQNRKAGQAAIDEGKLVRIPSPPVVSDARPIPTADYPVAPNPNLRTPLPAAHVQQPDMQRQWQTGATPQQRIPPTSLTGNPIAAAQTITNIVAASVAASSTPVFATDIESISINKQTGTAYNVNLNDRNTLVTLNNNAGGTVVLPGPPLGASGFDKTIINSGTGTTASASGQPFLPGEFALLSTAIGNAGASIGAPSPGSWTLLDSSNGSQGTLYALFLPTSAVVSESQSITGVPWATSLSFFGSSTGLAPTLRQSQTLAGGNFGPGSSVATFATFPNILAGNGILVSVNVDLIFTTDSNMSVTDSAGNTYIKIAQILNGTGIGSSAGSVLFWTANLPASNPTVTLHVPTGNFTGTAKMYELAGVGAITGPSNAGFFAGWYTFIQNTGTGIFNVISTANIDGAFQSVSVGPNQGLMVVYDGSSWFTERGISFTLPLSVANGGTGDTTLTAHNVLLGEGASPVGFAAPGTATQILTSNGPSSDPTFQALNTSTISMTVNSNVLIGTFTVSDSADIRGLTVFCHIRGKQILNACKNWRPRFAFGTAQGAGTITMTHGAVYQMNQVNPSGNLFQPYTLSAVAAAVGNNTTYTGTNLGSLVPGVRLEFAGFTNAGNNAQGRTVQSSTTTTVTVDNPNGVAETHAGTAQLGVIASGGLPSFIYAAPGGASDTYTLSNNLPLDPAFDYVYAIYFAVADTPIPIIAGIGNTFANDGNTLRGATASGDFTGIPVNGVLPAFTNYPTPILIHQIQVVS